jgi:hypothetical protein
VKGDSRNSERNQVLLPLVVGFVLSSVAVFAAAWAIGNELRSLGWASAPASTLLAISLLALAAIDVVFPRLRPPMLRRQTPKNLVGRFSPTVGGFLWGLDAGSVVSTFRASSASMAGLILAVAGWIPPWGGLVYAAAFCVPLIGVVSVRAPTRRLGRSHARRGLISELTIEGDLAVARLMGVAQKVRLISAGLLAATAAVVFLEAIQG